MNEENAMSRRVSDLTREELVALAEGLRSMMYGDTDDDGNDIWNPTQSVSGGDLVAWAAFELDRLKLVPEAGPWTAEPKSEGKMFPDQKKPTDQLDRRKLVEAAQTALNCFRAVYEAIEDGADADELYDDPSYWPLSLLRSALGDQADDSTAKENWANGEYIGADEIDEMLTFDDE